MKKNSTYLLTGISINSAISHYYALCMQLNYEKCKRRKEQKNTCNSITYTVNPWNRTECIAIITKV